MKQEVFEIGVLEVLLTLAGMVLSMKFLGDEDGLVREGSLNSCIIQSVLIPLAALPLQNTRDFFRPIHLEPSEEYIGRSVPVAFQNPALVTLLGLALFLYFLSLGQQKYHSFSPVVANSTHHNHIKNENLVRYFDKVKVKRVYVNQASVSSLTWKIPRIILIDIKLLDELNRKWPLLNLSLQIKSNKLLVCWMEPETRQHNLIQFLTIIISLFHVLKLFSSTKLSLTNILFSDRKRQTLLWLL